MIIAITVTGEDRPGIISALSGAILKARGNLEDASMTILEGEFAMIFLTSLKKSNMDQMVRKLTETKKKFNLSISLKEIKRKVVRGEKHRHGTEPWVISVLGQDRSGIVHGVCNALSSLKLNITDLNSKIMGSGKKASYALVLEVDLPRNKAVIGKLKKRFESLEKQLRVSISFHPLETAYL